MAKSKVIKELANNEISLEVALNRLLIIASDIENDELAQWAEEAFDLGELEENMPKREQLYNLSAAALRAFGEVSGELQEKYHYTLVQIKAIEDEVIYYIKVRDDVRLASGDYVDLKKYDPDMRHLIDTYLSADPSRVLTSFGGATISFSFK